MGPQKNMDVPSPGRKAHENELNKRADSTSNTFARLPVRGDIKRGYIHNRIGDELLCIIMAAAKRSPAVASRHAKYYVDFRVPAVLDAQPFDHTARTSPTRHAQYRHGNIT